MIQISHAAKVEKYAIVSGVRDFIDLSVQFFLVQSELTSIWLGVPLPFCAVRWQQDNINVALNQECINVTEVELGATDSMECLVGFVVQDRGPAATQ